MQFLQFYDFLLARRGKGLKKYICSDANKNFFIHITPSFFLIFITFFSQSTAFEHR